MLGFNLVHIGVVIGVLFLGAVASRSSRKQRPLTDLLRWLVITVWRLVTWLVSLARTLGQLVWILPCLLRIFWRAFHWLAVN